MVSCKNFSGQSDTRENRGAFILLLAMFTLLAWQVTRPLMMAILWAGMLSFMMMPLFRYIYKITGGRFRDLSAGLALCLLGVLFVVPLLIVLTSLGNEVAVLVSNLSIFISRMEIGEIKDLSELLPVWVPVWMSDHLRSFLNDSESVRLVIQKLAQWSGGFLTDFSKVLIQGASSFFFEIIIVLMVTFFFIRDGEQIVDYIKTLIPLTQEENTAFFSRAKNLLSSIIYGILLTVSIQAVLGGFGWWFVGLKNPAFFGMLMFFFGMFPAGTAVIWLPGSIYLMLTGDIKNGVILLLWGTAIVGTIDNLLRPFLISSGGKGENVPTLLTVLGLFGGMLKWGFLGLFLGPLILVLFLLVLDLYKSRCIDKNDEGSAAA